MDPLLVAYVKALANGQTELATLIARLIVAGV
jgi:hypothetical protein